MTVLPVPVSDKYPTNLEINMEARIENPALAVPGAMKALAALGKTVTDSDAPEATLHLVELRASQINGCSVCVELHTDAARKAGESVERLFAVSAWRESPLFTDAERAALDLAESVTRLSDRPDPVPDTVWNEATRHFDEPAMAALVLDIASINLWNRVNVTTRQVAGDWSP